MTGSATTPNRLSRSRSRSGKPTSTKRSVSAKHRTNQGSTKSPPKNPYINKPINNPPDSHTNQSAASTANSSKSSPLVNAQTTPNDNRNLGSARGGDDPSANSTLNACNKARGLNSSAFFTPVTSKKQRRKEKQLNDTEGDDADSITSDSTQKRATSLKTCLSVNFFVPPAEHDADVKLINVAKKWMTKLMECDNNVAILPWYDSDMGEDRITKVSNIPPSLFMFKKYFQRGNPKEEGGKVYTDVYLSHTKPMEVIKGDLSWFLKKEQIDIYIKDIQSDTTARLGWLLFSFQGLDVTTLCAEISAILRIEIAGRYKPILTDTWDKSIESKHRLKAVHLECARKDERKAKKELGKLYSSTSTIFPLGIRMRLVAEYKEVKGNIVNIKKHCNLRAKQAHFTKKLGSVFSEDIMNLDVVHSTLGKSLREMIMQIKTWDAQRANMFHAVNLSWKGDKIVFSFPPSNELNATMVVDGLIPFLRWLYGDEVMDFFTPDACLEKADWTWDKENMCVINPLGEDLAAIDGADADYDFSVYGEGIEIGREGVHDANDEKNRPRLDVMPQAAAVLAQTHLDRVVLGLDDDSVSTLGTAVGSRFAPRPIGVPTGGAAATHIGGRSVAGSIATMDSRVSRIENVISSMETNLTSSMEKSMEALLLKFLTKSSEKSDTTNDAKPSGGAPGADP